MINVLVCNNCCIKSSKHGKQSRKDINIKPFINQYNWKDINIKEDREKLEKINVAIDWKKFEQNIKTIALNILFELHNTKK